MPILPPEPAPPPPPKPKKKGCGVIGQIIAVVIAIVVFAVTKDFVTSAKIFGSGFGSGVAAAATAGAASSVASQGFLMATGAQSKFDWKGLAISTISAGVSKGLPSEMIKGAGAGVNAVAHNVARSVITQGISLATGLQKKFDWTGVAVSAVTAGFAASGAASWLGNAISAKGYVAQGLAGLSMAAAGAATRSAIDGTDFGDAMEQAIPDVVGSLIGGMITDKLKQQPTSVNSANDHQQAASYGSGDSIIDGGFCGPNPKRRWYDGFVDFAKGIGNWIGDLTDVDNGQTNFRNIRSGQRQTTEDLSLLHADENGNWTDIVVTAKRPNVLERTWNTLAFGAGVGWGFAKDTVQGAVSLGDYVVRDMGGSILYGINETLDVFVPGDLPNPYRQSYVDYTNANQAAFDLGKRVLTDLPGLTNDISASFSSASDASNARGSAFERGMTNPAWKVITGVATLPLAATKGRAVSTLGQVARATDAEVVAGDVARTAEVANTTRVGGGLGNIAFGLWRHQGTGDGGMLTRFAEHVGAKSYWDFYDPRVFPTESNLERLMYGADRIHVNLDGLLASQSQLPEVVQMGSRGLDFIPPSGGGNVTNWEIWRIHQDPVLLDRTTFYLDGRPLNR